MSLSALMSSSDDAGAAGGAPAPGAPAAPAPAAEAPLQYADWHNAFGTDPLGDNEPSPRDWVAKKGFKSADELVRSAREAEKAIGSRIPIPQAPDDPRWGEVYDKLGRPAAPDQYKISGPEGMTPNPEFTKPFAERAHAAGLTQAQVEQMVGWWNETALQSIEGQKAAVEAQMASLKSEWGADYGKNLQLMRRGAETLGLDKDGVDKLGSAFGVDGAAKLLAGLGGRVAEDLLHQGDAVVTSLSVEELRAELNKHVRENGAQIRSGDPAAKATHARLINQLAAAEQARQKRG